MFRKFLGSFVSFLFIFSLKPVSSIGIPSCSLFKYSFNDECIEENPVSYCIKSENGNNKIYGLNEEKNKCSAPLNDGTYVFSINDNTATLITSEMEEINENSLVMYQCSTSDDIQSCKQTAGYIRMGHENKNYYSIPMNNGKSSKIIETKLSNNCLYNSNGNLVKLYENEIFFCLNGNNTIEFPYSNYNQKKYLVHNTNIRNGVFYKINKNLSSESSIVISLIPDRDNFPSMIAFDPFYSKINYCYDRNDDEIMDRKRNLCKSGSNCEYYYCDSGICEPSYTSCPGIVNNRCNPRDYDLQKNCEDGYYLTNESNGLLINSTNEYGILYYCEKQRCRKFSNRLGYYVSSDTSNNIKYIKCTNQYYMLEYEQYGKGKSTGKKRYYINKRQKDSTNDNANNNTGNNENSGKNNENNGKTNENGNKKYVKFMNKFGCEGITENDIDTTCSKVGQLIRKDDKIVICLSNENDEAILSFAEENNGNKEYKLIKNEIFNVNINSTSSSIKISNVVVEINEDSIQTADGIYLSNTNGILTSTEGDTGTMYECYGTYCNYNQNIAGYYPNKLFNLQDSTSSPFIQCTQSENGKICKNIKVNKTKCGTGERNAKEGELFITPATEMVYNNDELLSNSNKDEYEASQYYDGNYYNICLDTSTEKPISLRLNWNNYNNYMMRKTESNVFGSGNNDEYSVIEVSQFKIRLTDDYNLYQYTDANYKILPINDSLDNEDNICNIGGSLIEFEGECKFNVDDLYIEKCYSYKKSNILNNVETSQNNGEMSPILGNLVFYGRGQNRLAELWNENKDIEGSEGVAAYFPSNDNSTEESITFSNKPLVLYLPGRLNNKYSYASFHTIYDKGSINLYTYHMIKSELKLIPPTVEELINSNYTCESLNLSCSELSEYDWNEDYEWVYNTDIRLFLRSEELDEYEIELDSKITNRWQECIGYIYNDKKEYKRINFNELVIKNYGSMPVYILVGNTMFLKREPTYIVKEGVIQKDFSDWSWFKSDSGREPTYFGNEVYEDDFQQKNCVKFIAKTDGEYCYYAHTEKFMGVPEAVSFRIRPMNDNQFKFKIDNKMEYNLTSDYFIHRNCKIPIGIESNVLIDVRSLVYSNPTYLLNNDIFGFWIQTISEIENIKKKLIDEKGKEASDAYSEVLYFYDLVMHNTYPDDLYNYSQFNLDEDGDYCRIEQESHMDWGKYGRVNEKNPVIQWPEDIDLNNVNS